MKKFIMIMTIVILLVGCSIGKEVTPNETDALKFKEEYEELNGEKTSYGDDTYRTLEIEEDNPFVYKEANDIIEMIDNKETFVVYFGFASCPWCRSVISNLITASENLELSTIYYVDVKEIRDTLKLDEDGNVVTEKEGSEGYYKLLEKLDTVLDEYTLTDEEGNEINTNEKRIYAPNIISVVDGVPTQMTTGISDKQTDAYMELTEEIKVDSYNQIKSTLDDIVEDSNTCNEDSKC